MEAQSKKRVAVIGCTGSVGGSALDVCRSYPEDFTVTALAADTGRDTFPALCREFGAKRAVLSVPRTDLPADVQLACGEKALLDLIDPAVADHFVFASSGVAAVKALQKALEAGLEVSLANKESALILGARIAPFVERGQLRPLDSEHNALWQCLAGEKRSGVAKLILTASGGPFLRTPPEQLEAVTPAQAAAHPVWPMGRKISVDSATMINKGIELLEASYLFGVPASRVGAVIHPGSKVHALVSFADGASKLLLSPPDMRLAALTALSWPKRPPLKLSGIAPVSLDGLDLHFEAPTRDRFPGFFTALDAAKLGEPFAVILIAADEAAVKLFLEEKIPFTGIARLVAAMIDRYEGGVADSVEERIALYERCLAAAEELAVSGTLGGAAKKGWR